MRAICTSASLQASTWVSPGFTLFRHSSPPFGSKQAHSSSTHGGRPVLGIYCNVHTTGAFAPPFQYERSTGNDIFSLARLFDSLVRVSRRWRHPISFANIEHHRKTHHSPLLGCGALTPRPFHQYPHFCTWLPHGFRITPYGKCCKVGFGR